MDTIRNFLAFISVSVIVVVLVIGFDASTAAVPPLPNAPPAPTLDAERPTFGPLIRFLWLSYPDEPIRVRMASHNRAGFEDYTGQIGITGDDFACLQMEPEDPAALGLVCMRFEAVQAVWLADAIKLLEG